MSNRPLKAKQKIARTPIYIPGYHGDRRGVSIVLSANENPWGPGKKAIQYFNTARDNANEWAGRYPDASHYVLRHAIARQFNINIDHIVCGAGSDELISLLAQCYTGARDQVLYSEHGFLMYPIAAHIAGSHPIKLAEQGLKTDINAFNKAINKHTKAIFIANPNNPTGSWLTKEEIYLLVESTPPNCLLVIDEAYAEYAIDDPDISGYQSALDMVESYPNLCVLRTFSKIHALAGLRVGWGYMSSNIAQNINRVRSPFNITSISQGAAAQAITDTIHIKQSREHNRQERKRLTTALNEMGFQVKPSGGNFILADFKTQKNAQSCSAYLTDNHIFVRQMQAYGLAQHLRITIGLREDNEQLLRCLKDFSNKQLI